MKNVCLCIAACCLCGCAQQYVMKLTNGMEVTCPGKPKLKGVYYAYKGPHGEEQYVPQSRVLEVEPASMAEHENQFGVSQPKEKHWYWPF